MLRAPRATSLPAQHLPLVQLQPLHLRRVDPSRSPLIILDVQRVWRVIKLCRIQNYLPIMRVVRILLVSHVIH